MAYEKIDSEFVQNNAYMQKENGKLAQKLKNPLNYDLIFFLSVPLGAFLAFLIFSKEKKIDLSYRLKEAFWGVLGGFLGALAYSLSYEFWSESGIFEILDFGEITLFALGDGGISVFPFGYVGLALFGGVMMGGVGGVCIF